MHVVVIGCGRVGSGLAVEFTNGGHTVAIIDKAARAFRRLPADWPGQRIVGFGFDRDNLDEAGATRATAFAAVTSGDNSNILCARIARETYEIPNVVARIYDPRRAEIFQRLGIPTVPTVAWTIDHVLRQLLPERIATEWSDSTGRLQLVERPIPAAWAGRPLPAELQSGGLRVAAVTRAGMPTVEVDDLVGQVGDVLHLLVTVGAEAQLEALLPRTENESGNSGGGTESPPAADPVGHER